MGSKQTLRIQDTRGVNKPRKYMLQGWGVKKIERIQDTGGVNKPLEYIRIQRE